MDDEKPAPRLASLIEVYDAAMRVDETWGAGFEIGANIHECNDRMFDALDRLHVACRRAKEGR